MSTVPARSLQIRFGSFCLDGTSGELRKGGILVKLQPHPFRILYLLAERAGQVVDREEIRRQLWNGETFVDFDRSINFCVNQIRVALSDDAEKPRYVETLPRRGYRFIASVSVVAEPEAAITSLPAQVRQQKTKPFKRQWIIAAAIATALVLVAFLARPAAPVPRITGIHQITHLGNVVKNQNLLVAGSRVYFASQDNAGFHMEYSSLGNNSVSSIQNLSPKTELQDISPSGNELLVSEIELGFASQWTRTLWRLPIAGGVPHRLGNILADSAAWSPDGQTIVYTNEVEQSLNLVDADGTNSRKIATFPERPSKPRWSPDGKLIRTSLSDQNGGISLWQVEVSGKNPVRVLRGWDDSSQLGSGKWTVDGRSFLFTASNGNTRNIWALREKPDIFRMGGARPSQLTNGSIGFSLPTPSRDGRMIYAVGFQPRGQLMRYDQRSHQFGPYLNGLSGDSLSFSRDGLWVAYVGYPEGVLMISRLDGSQRLQLTFAPMRAYAPRWSPDGSQIAFAASAAPGKPMRIYVVSPRGGSARRLMPEIGGEQREPEWLSDGGSILFGCWNESGETVSLHMVDIKTGRETFLPGSLGLTEGRVSPDGRSIAATSADPNESLVLYDIASHSKRMLVQVAVSPYWSADGKYIYYSTLMKGVIVGLEGVGVYRVRVSDGHIDRLAPAPTFTLAGNWGRWSGPAPDGSPLLLREVGTSDVYGLDVDKLRF